MNKKQYKIEYTNDDIILEILPEIMPTNYIHYIYKYKCNKCGKYVSHVAYKCSRCGSYDIVEIADSKL